MKKNKIDYIKNHENEYIHINKKLAFILSPIYIPIWIILQIMMLTLDTVCKFLLNFIGIFFGVIIGSFDPSFSHNGIKPDLAEFKIQINFFGWFKWWCETELNTKKRKKQNA